MILFRYELARHDFGKGYYIRCAPSISQCRVGESRDSRARCSASPRASQHNTASEVRGLSRQRGFQSHSTSPNPRDTRTAPLSNTASRGRREGMGGMGQRRVGQEQNGPGPNFVGHYIVIVWGCGAGCLRMAMSDAETGAVYNPPISDQGFALPMLVFPNSAGRSPDLQYRRNSRLMIIKATPHADRRDAIPYAFYFLWQPDYWTLLRRVSIDD
jgi:hypothetical protein